MTARSQYPSSVDAFASRIVTKRGRVTLGIALITLLFGLNIPKIRASFSPEHLFPQSPEQRRIAAELSTTFGDADNTVLFLVRADNVLEQAPLQYLHTASRHFRDHDLTERATSITLIPFVGDAAIPAPIVSGGTVNAEHVARFRRALIRAPLVDGSLIGRNRQVAVIAIELADDTSKSHIVDVLEDYVRARPPPAGVAVSFAGLPYMNATMIRKLSADQTVLLPAALLVCLLILGVSFRWLPGVVFATLTVGVSAVWLVGGMALVGEPFNVLNNILPLLVVIIGLSDSIHLLNRYNEALGGGASGADASRAALRAMTFACFVTSFTTAIGLGSVIAAGIPILTAFGITAAAGVTMAYIVTVTLLPATLAMVSPPRRAAAATGDGVIERAMEQLTRALLRRRGVVLGLCAALLAASAFAVTRLDADDRVLDQFSPEEEAYQTMKLLERELDGVRPLEVSLTSARPRAFLDPAVIAAIDRTQAWLRTQPGVLRSTSYTDHLHEVKYAMARDAAARTAPITSAAEAEKLAGLLAAAKPNPLRRFVTPEFHRARIGVRLADIGAKANLALGKRLEAELRRQLGDHHDIDIVLTGETIVSARGLQELTRGMVKSLFFAVALIFLFMVVLFRDVRLGVLSLPISLTPLLGTMAYMAARGIPLNSATVIIFSITIGLAVDGAIHMLVRFNDERRAGLERDAALVRAARGTGKANLVTCVTLAIGFSVLQLSAFVPVRRFGELIAVTAVGCLFATLVVLPPLLSVGLQKHVSESADAPAAER